jgi:HSP20 family protein
MGAFRELERRARELEARLPRFRFEFEEPEEEQVTTAIDSYFANGNYVVCADVPGLKPADLTITVTHNVLTIKGERKRDKEIPDEDFLCREVVYGPFERSLTLPSDAAADKAKATFSDGVLEISVPLAKEIVAVKVPIEVETEKQVEVERP